MLKVCNLSKFYELKKHWYLKKERHIIFDNINFSLNENDNLIILGKSGAGKSTLARILCFLEVQVRVRYGMKILTYTSLIKTNKDF